MLSRKAIAYLTDFIAKYIWRHYDLDHLLDMIDLDPSKVAPGLVSSSSIEARIKSFFINLSNEPSKIIEFLNVFLERYGQVIEKHEIESIKPWLEACGITITYEQMANERKYIAKLIVPAKIVDGTVDYSLLSTLVPRSVLERVEEAEEQYGNGRFDFVIAKCRTSLEALANENGYGLDFKKMVKDLYDNGKIREQEYKLLKKLYDYFSSFESTHAGPKPNKHQALYALNLTKYTLLFLADVMERR